MKHNFRRSNFFSPLHNNKKNFKGTKLIIFLLLIWNIYKNNKQIFFSETIALVYPFLSSIFEYWYRKILPIIRKKHNIFEKHYYIYIYIYYRVTKTENRREREREEKHVRATFVEFTNYNSDEMRYIHVLVLLLWDLRREDWFPKKNGRISRQPYPQWSYPKIFPLHFTNSSIS